MPKASKLEKPVIVPKPTRVMIQAAVARLDVRYELAVRLRRCSSQKESDLRRVAKGSIEALSYENLRKLLQLAEMVPDESDWKKLRKLRLKSTRMPLTWTHLIALVSADSKEKLLATARLAAENGWTESQIRRHIQDESGIRNRRPGTGRPMKAPNDLMSGMRQLMDDLRVVSKRIQFLRKLAVAEPVQGALLDRLVALSVAVSTVIEQDSRPTTAPST